MKLLTRAAEGTEGGRWRAALSWGMTLFAFSLPLSIVPAQIFGYGSVLLGLIVAIRRPGAARALFRQPMAIPVAAFAAVAVLASAFGPRPAPALGKCERLLLLPLVWLAPWAGAPRLARAWLAGVALRGGYDLIRIPLSAARGAEWFVLGNMRDPQFYMAALLLTLAAPFLLPARRGAVGTGWALYAAGVALHFKRGVWLAGLGAGAALAALTRRRRLLLAGALALTLLAAWPPARARVATLPSEWSRRGGRMTLWTKVAPALIRQYPWGIGFRATRHEDFTRITKHVEPRLRHLHNNILQITVELGWIGLAAWLWWMASAIRALVRRRRTARAAGDAESAALALGVLVAVIGLLLNGMVEYNFGDGEIFMLFLLLFGLGTARPG